MVQAWAYGIDNTHSIDLDSWYSLVIGKDSRYRYGLMVSTRTHGIDILMVLTTAMKSSKTHGIQLVLLNHTHTRGLSVALMRDLFDIFFLGYFLMLGERSITNCNYAQQIGKIPHTETKHLSTNAYSSTDSIVGWTKNTKKLFF